MPCGEYAYLTTAASNTGESKKSYAFFRQWKKRRKKEEEKSERLSVPIDGKQQWGLPSSVLPSLYSFHVLIGPVLGVRWPCQASSYCLLRGWTFLYWRYSSLLLVAYVLADSVPSGSWWSQVSDVKPLPTLRHPVLVVKWTGWPL